jgi:hypothetical protein
MCRTYSHDYYARKMFLSHVLRKDQEISAQMLENAKKAAVEEQVRRPARAA